MSNYPGLKAAVAAGPDRRTAYLIDLYDRANAENDGARERAKDGLNKGQYDLSTDLAGDVFVVKINPDEPYRCLAAYLQGVVMKRRTALGEEVPFPTCMCHAHTKAHRLNEELFRAGFEPFVGCKHLHIRRILEARALNARVTVSPGERLSLAIAERGGLK